MEAKVEDEIPVCQDEKQEIEKDVTSQSSQDDKTDDTAEDEEEEEGSHMTCLRQALDKTIRRCVDSARLSAFQNCYPDIAKTNMAGLQEVHKNYKEKLWKAIKSEMKIMFKEENIPEMMKTLDSLVDEAPEKPDGPAWRPSGDPQTDVRAHLMEVKLKHKARLQRCLQELNMENKKLASIRSVRQKKLAKTQEVVQEKRDYFKQCVEQTSDIKKAVGHFLQTTQAANNMT